jgi:DNA-directed RNA polymerase subunit H (RpoH/RPB5)
MKQDEIKELIDKYNLSLSQLPKIKSTDATIPEGSVVGDVIRIDRKFGDKSSVYYRVVA